MIVEKSPSSERSRGHRPNLAESSDEVGFMIGDLTSRRTSPSDVEGGSTDCIGARGRGNAPATLAAATNPPSTLPCDWCDKPAVVKFWGLWCGWHALVEIGPFPWFEWVRKWDA